MTFISVFRNVVLGKIWCLLRVVSHLSYFRPAGLALFFSIVILGLTAHWTQGSTELLATVFDFEIVALLTACACILILPVL